MIAEGRNINVTLIFSLDRYQEVIEAYIAGLEPYAKQPGADLSKVASVASFFISRVDTEIDRRLEAIGSPEALALRGKGAVAQGKLAYQLFQKTFSGPRWEALGGQGRRRAAAAVGQHVDEEPGLPRHPVRRRADRPRHGQHPARRHHRGVRRPRHLARRVDADSTRPRRRGTALAEVGVDLDDVADKLEREGVSSFQKSFDELLGRPRGEGRPNCTSVTNDRDPSTNCSTVWTSVATVVSASQLARVRRSRLAGATTPDTLDLKIASAALEEMREAFKMFAPFRDIPKVTIFGSARTQMADPLYMQARDVATKLADAGWMVVTGAGPGIMQAGMEGAGREHSIGVSIRLPFEQGANPVIAGDVKYVSMKYFFTRKLMLIKESRGLRLPARRVRHARRDVRAAHADPDRQGHARCRSSCSTLPATRTGRPSHDFVGHQLVERGLVSAADTSLYLVTDDTQAAVDEVARLLPQLRLDPVRRRPRRDAPEARADRRAARRCSTSGSASSAQRTGSCVPRRSSRSARSTTSSTCRASRSPSPSTATATSAS